MNSNKFELIGTVNYIDLKATDKGNFICKVLLGIYLGKDKEGKGLYDSVEITMFGDTAESFGNEVEKKNNVYFEGRIGINKYTNKDGVEIAKPQFIANSYAKVVYDKDKKGYAAVIDELPWKNK